MEDVARIVLALETSDVAEEVMHFLDRTGRARVVGTAVDASQLAEAVRQLEPDAVIATPNVVASRDILNGSALLAVDTSQSVGGLRRAIRAGASGFYLWPAEREELALAAARVVPPREEHIGDLARVIAVVAARGGAGATFVATHLAAALAKRGRHIVLIDLDVLFADVSSAIGVPAEEPVRTIADLAPFGEELSQRHVMDVLWEDPHGFSALLAPGEPRASAAVSATTYRAAIASVRGSCDVVVLHVPRAFDEVTRTGLQVADRVLVVVGLDVLSFRDAKRAIELAGLEGRCSFVVNRAVRAEITPGDVERVFGQPPLAVIPSDRAVATAQDHGRLVPMRGRVGRALDRLASGVHGDG